MQLCASYLPNVVAVLLLKHLDQLFLLVREDLTVKLLIDLVPEVYGFILLACEVSNHLWYIYFATLASQLGKQGPKLHI